MQNIVLKRVSFLTSVMPLPALAIVLILMAANRALDWAFISGLILILSIVIIVTYLSSLVLTIICGLMEKRRTILLPPLLSFLDMILFLSLMPTEPTSVGWRTIDIVLIVALVLLNIIQTIMMRKLTRMSYVELD